MYSIAKTIGLPATYVELRHQATHEELPSLPKLRTATQKALRWIWDYYWSKLPDIPNTNTTQDCKIFLRNLLFATGEFDSGKIRRELGKWRQDELVEGLMELQNTTEDVTALLRASRLQQQIILSHESDPEIEHGSEQTQVEKLREEMLRMEEELISSSQNPSDSVAIDNTSTSKMVKGWAQWDEPNWVPKPIGIV